MSQQKKLKEMIVELLRDGEIHSSEEIRELALKKGIIDDEKSTSIRNAIFQLKKENCDFITPEKGRYMLQTRESHKHDGSKMSFDQTMEIVDDIIDSLSHFNWINCTDAELAQARQHMAQLKKMADRVTKLYDGVQKRYSYQ